MIAISWAWALFKSSATVRYILAGVAAALAVIAVVVGLIAYGADAEGDRRDAKAAIETVEAYRQRSAIDSAANELDKRGLCLRFNRPWDDVAKECK